MTDEGITDLPPKGVILPKAVDVKRVEKPGYSEETRTCADGSKVEFTIIGGRYIEISREFPDGKMIWYKELPNGKYLKIGEKFPDGTERQWYNDGKRSFVKLPDGTEHRWMSNGIKISEKLPDGTERRWFSDGKREYEYLPNGTKIEWYEGGKIAYAKLPNGTECRWDENGQKSEETFFNGLKRSWYENGQMKEETWPDGTYRSWYEDGQLFNEELPNGKKTHFCSRAQELSVTYPNDKVLIYGKDYTMMNDGERTFVLNKTLSDGSKITYFPRSKIIAYKSLPDGTKYGYYRNGNLKYEITSKYKLYVLRDGTKKYKLADGKEIVLKTDKSGRVVYHSVNGVEDTKEYLARRILAAKKMYFNSLRKSKGTVVNSDGSTRERTVAPKMSPLGKAVGMLWARRKLAKQM